MSGYTETLTVTVPESLAEIAAKIGRAIDTDRGGADSFTSMGDGTIVCRTPCKPHYKAALMSMVGNAAALHGYCLQDYSTRWPEHTPPTLTECQSFLSQSVIE